MELIPVGEKDRELLWNINQKYLYEMTMYYDDELDAKGVLHYGYFDAYFTDPNRKAFFLYEEGSLVGFAMLHPYSNFGGAPDYVLAEFTVFPMYRRKHFATEATKKLFERFKGEWEIKFNEKNGTAKALWLNQTAPYHPKLISLSDVETVLSFRIDE